jgi:GntR family transcriptional repressor for pyruvate dehydrogenase complex
VSALLERSAGAKIPAAIAQDLQRRITTGEFGNGDRLPSVDALAREFGVSRASIREALQGLAALGVIEILHGKGSFVCATSSSVNGYSTWIREQQYQLQELCELRMAVETTAAQLAAFKATNVEIRELADVLAKMRRATADLHETVALGTRFHTIILSASRNRLLDQAIALTADYLIQARYRMHSVPGEIDHALAAHAAILEAIERRDPDRAMRAMHEHLRAVALDLGIHLP